MRRSRSWSGSLVFEQGDATRMPFADGVFDAAWLQHASMNIEAKDVLFAEIHRVVRPRGRLVLHEVLAGPTRPIHFPVPWASDSSLSFLETERAMRALLHEAGFVETAWRDTTRAGYEWWRARLAAIQENGPPRLGIHLLLASEPSAIAASMLRNLEERRIAVAFGVLERP